MSRSRWLLTAGAFLMLTSVGVVESQQVPDEVPGEVPVIEVTPAPSAAADPEETERKIRQALEGGTVTGAADPMLDEVLQIIRRNGSVLRGTAFDSDRDRDLDLDERDFEEGGRIDSWQHRTRAAETLLRAARVLSTVRPVDRERRDLVLQMREEALRLLTE